MVWSGGRRHSSLEAWLTRVRAAQLSGRRAGLGGLRRLSRGAQDHDRLALLVFWRGLHLGSCEVDHDAVRFFSRTEGQDAPVDGDLAAPDTEEPTEIDHGGTDFIRGSQISVGTGNLQGGPISHTTTAAPPGTPRWGAAYRDYVAKSFTRQVAMVAQTENLPYADQTIDLDPDVKDVWGLPAPRGGRTSSRASSS